MGPFHPGCQGHFTLSELRVLAEPLGRNGFSPT